MESMITEMDILGLGLLVIVFILAGVVGTMNGQDN